MKSPTAPSKRQAATPAHRRGGDAGRIQNPSQVIAPAAAASPSHASPCRPKQPAHVVRWLVATAGMARTDRWPVPEVKPRLPQGPDVRGSRASTDPRTPPDLFNPAKGLSMAKTASASVQLARKFVPVAELPKDAQLPQSRTRETVIHRGYTLCEGKVIYRLLRLLAFYTFSDATYTLVKGQFR
jgi:hypothetical protein